MVHEVDVLCNSVKSSSMQPLRNQKLKSVTCAGKGVPWVKEIQQMDWWLSAFGGRRQKHAWRNSPSRWSQSEGVWSICFVRQWAIVYFQCPDSLFSTLLCLCCSVRGLVAAPKKNIQQNWRGDSLRAKVCTYKRNNGQIAILLSYSRKMFSTQAERVV